MFCVRLIDRLSLIVLLSQKLQIQEEKLMSGKAMFFGYLRLGGLVSAIGKPAVSGQCLVSSD